MFSPQVFGTSFLLFIAKLCKLQKNLKFKPEDIGNCFLNCYEKIILFIDVRYTKCLHRSLKLTGDQTNNKRRLKTINRKYRTFT